jgi:hypothetical protein
MKSSISNDLMQMLIGRKDYEFISLEVAKEGKFDGAFCFTDRYWSVLNDHIVIYVGKKQNSYSPQCNNDIRITERLNKELFGNFGFPYRVEFLPYAYIDGRRYHKDSYSI